jgi:ribokinase
MRRGLPVAVAGSLNIDYLAAVQRLPKPGETVPSKELLRRFGGKGANQAIAAARQGSSVRMMGCLGSDDDGAAYLRHLRSERIDVRGISRSENSLTGTALIAVEDSGENTIIVAAGANRELRPRHIEHRRTLLTSAGALLTQFEIPRDTVLATIRAANKAGVAVVLNPSPFSDDFPWGHVNVDTVIANHVEAEKIFELNPGRLRRETSKWTRALARFRVRCLIITRGSASTLVLTEGGCVEVRTLKVKPVDTVGAGDAFAGTFAARSAQGHDYLTAVEYANCAGALATLRRGAQEAIPGRAQTEYARRKLRGTRT